MAVRIGIVALRLLSVAALYWFLYQVLRAIVLDVSSRDAGSANDASQCYNRTRER
ncbi:MAG: hypothetical protein NUW23_03845 [Firmicutes bacterium]|jgi:hypothetical protein|nr:hypothetical protein [Bacillota bacterium]